MVPKGKYLNETQQKLVTDLVKQANLIEKYKKLQLFFFLTVGAIVKKQRLHHTFEIRTGQGRKPKLTPRDDTEILRIVKKLDLKVQKKLQKI